MSQIVGQVTATIPHPFIVANTTLPAGKYIFKMLTGSDLTLMTCRAANGDLAVEFLVDRAQAATTPDRTELIFHRYGNDDVLRQVFEADNKLGVAVAEPSRDELRHLRKGEQPVEHAEPAERE
jgi:hypothetical protein